MPVFDLGIQPLANDFCLEGEERQGYAPLKVMLCNDCGHAQLSVVVKPSILYSKYRYVTSPSLTMRHHFASLVSDMLKEGPAGSVVEIGSNDGLFLQYLSGHGFGNLVGIDPAINLAEIANSRQVHTVRDFFNADSARLAKDMVGKVDFIIARHVFCHIDDWQAFIRNVEILCDRDTVVCIEAPYGWDTLNRCEFDQVYHEHLSFLSVHAMSVLLKGTTLHIHNVLKYPVHGGAILIMLRQNGSKEPPKTDADVWKNDRFTLLNWVDFADEARVRIDDLRTFVNARVEEKKIVVGYGASAKSTVWINACGFTRKHIRYICDETPQKLSTFSPGSDIPIVQPEVLARERPDFAILWAWNFAEEIIAKEKAFRQAGGEWVIPVPELKII